MSEQTSTRDTEHSTSTSGADQPQVAATTCKTDVVCPTCGIDMLPEHAHYKCPRCHYRDSCCF